MLPVPAVRSSSSSSWRRWVTLCISCFMLDDIFADDADIYIFIRINCSFKNKKLKKQENATRRPTRYLLKATLHRQHGLFWHRGTYWN